MSLERRTRAVAGAGHQRETLRWVLAAVGIVAVVLGAEFHVVGVVAGAFLLGWVLGNIATSADRAYMEGFSDGIVTAETLGADEAGPGRPRADLRTLPPGPGDDERRAAHGAGGPAGGPVGDGEPRPDGVTAFAGPIDTTGFARRSRPVLTPEGEANPTELPANGPARFPIPPARPRAPDIEDRQPGPRPRRQTRRVKGEE